MNNLNIFVARRLGLLFFQNWPFQLQLLKFNVRTKNTVKRLINFDQNLASLWGPLDYSKKINK